MKPSFLQDNKNIMIGLDQPSRDRIKALAAKRSMSVSAMVRALITAAYEKEQEFELKK
jgi:hypothetical protein